VNEYSTRYSVAIDAAQQTAFSGWRIQAPGNRQGSEGRLGEVEGQWLSEEEARIQELSRKIYEERLALGVAREQARKDLPLSTYTEAYWKIDLHNLMRFLLLRMEGGAQLEIRQYATVIGQQIVARWCPIAWEAFLDYQVHGLMLSKADLTITVHLAAGRIEAAIAEAEQQGLVTRTGAGVVPRREARELGEKLVRLGLEVPWA